jgi:osmotically-inducible protein OsmY
VNDRLTDDPFLDATHIEVLVEGGEVTLSGTVSSRSDKRRSEDLADNVSGVKHVQNNLRVESAASSGPNPGTLTGLHNEGRLREE